MIADLPPYIHALDQPAQEIFGQAYRELLPDERTFLDTRKEPAYAATLSPKVRFTLAPNWKGKTQGNKMVVYDDAANPGQVAKHELGHLFTDRLQKEDISSFAERATQQIRAYAQTNPEIVPLLTKAHPHTKELFTTEQRAPRALGEILALLYEKRPELDVPVLQNIRKDLATLAYHYARGFGF